MKKLSLIALFALAGLVASAQKSVLVMGSIGYSSEETEATSHTHSAFEFAPMLGYQFNKSITVGAFANYSKEMHTGSHDMNSTVVGPFVRYTQSLSDIFSVYADTKLGWMSGTGGKSGWQFGITPAVLVNLKNGFGLNFNFGGVNYQAYGVNYAQTTDFGLTFGKQASIGISKHFGLK
jgi:zona occludens toxin (predicted ATPase)